MTTLAIWGHVDWTGWLALTAWALGWGAAGILVGRHLVRDADRRADRYRLAWLSARRRAHRGQLLAQLLREDER